jgi:predicted nucleic acid-binding protein
MGLIVDTSAFVKLFYSEKNSDKMDSLMQLLIKNGERILSMDLILYELGQIVLRKHKMGVIMARDFPQRLSAMTVNVLFPDDAILSSAMDISREFDTSFYDATYIAVSQKMDLPIVTEDQELIKKFENAMNIEEAYGIYSEMYL